MAKYNLTPKKEKVARYQTLLSDKLKDSLYEGILRIIVAEGKYKDKTARVFPGDFLSAMRDFYDHHRACVCAHFTS